VFDASGHPQAVVTGVGCVSPNGLGRASFTQALREGRSGLRRCEFTGPVRLKTSAVGLCDFDPTSAMSDIDLRRVPRMIPMALQASRDAITQASIPLDSLDVSRRTGVVLGTGGGGLAFVEEQYRRYFLDEKPSPFAITSGTHGNLSSELSIQLGLRGPSHVITTGCTSSTDALGYAMMLIESRRCDAVIAGGADSPITPGILSGFELMRVVSTRRWDDPAHASRPFDRDHDGFVLGEGAWMFVLESLDHARRRGAKVLAEMLGYGSTCDAYHRVQIAPDAAECVRACEMAVEQSGLGRDAIEHVNLHGTSTQMNDTLETAAMHRVFGARARSIPMSATKSMIGHPQGACGAAGVAATILSLRAGFVHPTINLDHPAEGCDLDYVPNVSKPSDATVALCNCIAFGSKNSALVIRVNRD
jgi:3-oxoacyl-[acyl-carrier-protein] synthase II